MLENLKDLTGAALRAAISKRIKVYTAAEAKLDSFLSELGELALASSEEMHDGLEEALAAYNSELEAIAASGRAEIDVSGDNVRGMPTSRVLDQVVQLDKFTAPPRDQLIKNYSYLKKARQYQDEMDYMITRLRESKDSDDKELLKSLIAHRKKMNEKKNKAQDVLESLAERHVPRELVRAAESIESHVLTLVGTAVSGAAGSQWFVTQEVDSLDFTYILHIPMQDHSKHNLDVYLALTGRVVETEKSFLMRVFLTSLNQFKLPGHYDLGTRIGFTSSQTMVNALKREANKLMAKQGLVSALSTNKLDTTTRQLRQAGITKLKHVIELRVQGDAIYLLLSDVSDADIEKDTVSDLIVLLKNTLHKQKKDAVFMRNLTKTKSGKKMMKIISVNEV